MFGIPLQRAQEIEALAANVWQAQAGGTLPVDTQLIFRRTGIVRRIVPGLHVEAEFDMSTGHPPFILDLQADDGRRSRYPQRLRFTEAHELGHFYLHDDPIVHREDLKTRKEAVKSGDLYIAIRENEADTFAGALLMPQNIFERDVADIEGQDFRRSAIKYNVTVEAATIRTGRLKNQLAVSGYAWGETGTIARMVPSLEFERLDPEAALRAWQANDIVPEYKYSRLSTRLIEDLKGKMRALGMSDLSTIKTTIPEVSFSELLLPGLFSSPYVGEFCVFGCNFDGRKIYFDLIFS